MNEKDLHSYLEAIGQLHMNNQQHLKKNISGQVKVKDRVKRFLSRTNGMNKKEGLNIYLDRTSDFVTEKLLGGNEIPLRVISRKQFTLRLIKNIEADRRLSLILNPRARGVIVQRKLVEAY